MTQTTHTTLGELIAEVYEELLALYGDADIASVATASIVNDMITRPDPELEQLEDAA